MGVTRWEYKTHRMSTYEMANSFDERLNAFGYEGWELVSVSDTVLIFKRPREEKLHDIPTAAPSPRPSPQTCPHGVPAEFKCWKCYSEGYG